MSHIKFKLVKFEKCLAFQILEMDERFRCVTTPITFNGPFIVTSNVIPSLESGSVFLRGNYHEFDDRVSFIKFMNNTDRDVYHDRLIKSLNEWSDKFPGFKETLKAKEVNNYTYTVYTQIMKHIKFNLIRLERSLVFQILEMDERFRSTSPTMENEYVSNNGIHVFSSESPDVKPYTSNLYLRGRSKKDDFNASIVNFKSNDQRDALAIKIIATLEDWSSNWPGFKTDEVVLDKDVYYI